MTAALNLTTPYSPTAIYYADSDCVEYVRKDALAIYDRVDAFLTLIYDMKARDELIGFRLKGFKHFFLSANVGLGNDFVAAVQVIERGLTALGNNVFDERRRRAYGDAIRMAHDDKVELGDLPKRAYR